MTGTVQRCGNTLRLLGFLLLVSRHDDHSHYADRCCANVLALIVASVGFSNIFLRWWDNLRAFRTGRTVLVVDGSTFVLLQLFPGYPSVVERTNALLALRALDRTTTIPDLVSLRHCWRHCVTCSSVAKCQLTWRRSGRAEAAHFVVTWAARAAGLYYKDFPIPATALLLSNKDRTASL